MKNGRAQKAIEKLEGRQLLISIKRQKELTSSKMVHN
jgi:hypothetical protein